MRAMAPITAPAIAPPLVPVEVAPVEVIVDVPPPAAPELAFPPEIAEGSEPKGEPTFVPVGVEDPGSPSGPGLPSGLCDPELRTPDVVEGNCDPEFVGGSPPVVAVGID